MGVSVRVLLLIFTVTIATWAQADANRAQVVGTVVDPRGALVPAATVRVRNLETGFGREVQTSSEGAFRFVQLDPGSYEIVAKAPGFAETTLTGVTLNVGAAFTTQITLAVQATSTVVEVADTMVSTVTPSPSTTIGNQPIVDLPINGRRFQDFATLTPSVQVDPSRGQLSFAGQRGINSNIMVDGADYNQPFFGGIRGGERSNFNFTLPQSAVQEFQAVTAGYAAEYGRSTGGLLNVITRSGANAFHGDLFYQNRDRSLSADNPIFKVQPSESLQQFGGSAGGPLMRDKLFLFGAYEHQLANTPAQVVFTQLQGFTPNAGSQEAYNFYKSQEVPFTRENRAVAGTLRGDYQFGAGHRLTLRYNTSDSNEPNSVTVGGALNPFTNLALSNEGTEENRTNFGTLQYTHLISPTVVNDLKFSGSYEARPRGSNSALPTVGSAIGTFGARSFLPTTQDDTRWQVSDGISAVLGAHTIKGGVDLNLLSTFQAFGFNQFGSFFVSGSNVQNILDILGTGGTPANRLDDRSVTYNRQVGNLLADFDVKQLAFYLQDSWRINSRFTLDLGVRYEGQFNPRVEANNTDLINRVHGKRVPNGATLDVLSIRDTPYQFMPRAGFAWSPMGTDRLVIRGHAGVFYAATPMLLFSGATNNFRLPAGDVSLALAPTATMTVYQQLQAAGLDLNQYSLEALPVIPVSVVQRASSIALGGTARDPFVGAALNMMGPGYHNPRSFQTGAGADYQLNSRWVLGGQFNLVNTAWLERNRDYNMPYFTIRDASGRPFYGLRSGAVRPIREQAAITVRESSARSLYRAFTISSNYRGSRLQFGANYTWSQTYSDDDNERDAGGASSSDTYNFRPDYNYSNLDARHQFNSYALYRLPWGFEVSGIFRVRSGLPLNASTGGDTNEDLFNTDRPYSAPGVVFLRNSYRNRSVVLNNDLRVLKSFNFSESVRLQLSAEIFNLFNLDNVVFAGNTNIYGVGIDSAGKAVAPDARFMVLRQSNGDYSTQNRQIGNPLQAQFGVRFFF